MNLFDKIVDGMFGFVQSELGNSVNLLQGLYTDSKNPAVDRPSYVSGWEIVSTERK